MEHSIAERSTIEQNRTLNSRAQSNVRLTNSCLLDFYVPMLTLKKIESD